MYIFIDGNIPWVASIQVWKEVSGRRTASGRPLGSTDLRTIFPSENRYDVSWHSPELEPSFPSLQHLVPNIQDKSKINCLDWMGNFFSLVLFCKRYLFLITITQGFSILYLYLFALTSAGPLPEMESFIWTAASLMVCDVWLTSHWEINLESGLKLCYLTSRAAQLRLTMYYAFIDVFVSPRRLQTTSGTIWSSSFCSKCHILL